MKYLKFIIVGLIHVIYFNANAQSTEVLSPDSLYNLGNAAFNEDKFDLAIFYFEKAKLLDPLAEDIEINLQLANEKLSTNIVELEPFFIASWWNKLSNIMLPGSWKIVSILILLSIFVLFYLYFIMKKIKSKNRFIFISSVLFIIFLISVSAGIYRSNHIFNSSIAIVFGGDQPLYIGPDVVSEEVKELTGGNKLRILDEDGEWYKVSTMDSEQGWIKKQNVKLIKF